VGFLRRDKSDSSQQRQPPVGGRHVTQTAATEPDDDLETTLGERLDAAEAAGTSAWDAMADLAAAMVTGESLDPSPEEGGPSWTLAGLDGRARGRLRDDLVARMQCPPDIVAEDLKLTWKYGYFLCALDELCED